MSDGKDLVPLTLTLRFQSTGAKKILSEAMDDALVIARGLKKSATRVENKGWREGIYAGDWVDEQPHGKGKFTFASGSVYEGGWVDGKRHGKGTYTLADGEVYESDWVDGKKHGKVTCTLADGGVYESDWVDGMNHGQRKTHVLAAIFRKATLSMTCSMARSRADFLTAMFTKTTGLIQNIKETA